LTTGGIPLATAIAQAERLLQSNPGEAAARAQAILRAVPGETRASLILARALRMAGRQQDAVAVLDPLSRLPNADVLVLLELGAIYDEQGDVQGIVDCFTEVCRRGPAPSRVWVVLGHALKTLGRQQESIATYREAIARFPSCGEAYWGIANLKTIHLTDQDVAAMRAQLGRTDITQEERTNFEFAMGKALGDAGDFAQSFAHYERANALAREHKPYSTSTTREFISELKTRLTKDFFAAREGWGAPSPDPIFIVGMPRAGSTLIEQILASHSAVEGTKELLDISHMTLVLGPWGKEEGKTSFLDVLSGLPRDRFRALGQEYLARTRTHRKLARPYFIDKMPGNFLHAGFIHLILPNAKIIDARRNPLACGLSGFTHHFRHGHSFFYNLENLGQYYADYVSLMAHWDAVLPGRVHRVQYEELVADPETNVRRLLDYCGLPFEENCLRFYENARAVHTPSSQQVRQPIYSDAVDFWRNYEPWLGPLKAALGSANAPLPKPKR